MDDFLSYTVKLDTWLKGEKLFSTGIYSKHPEVKRRAYKALIEETIKEQGALELAFGEELKDKSYLIDALLMGSGFLPLSVDEEKVSGREYYDGMPPGKTPKKTYKLGKIELIKFVPIINQEGLIQNKIEIQDAINKKAIINTISYLNEKGIFCDDGSCAIKPLRMDQDFLYYKKKGSKKEEKIKLKWIKYIQYDIYD